MEQMTLRLKTTQPITGKLNQVQEVDVNFFPNEKMGELGIIDGMAIGNNIFVSPEIFKGLTNADTFEKTISGLFVKGL